jgi:predicted TIM-barrel fold metal-dependent hydrolase
MHATTPLLLLRLYFSRTFDRHRNLRLILSQQGHQIPGLLPRINTLLSSLPSANRPSRTFLDIWQHNIYVTTADILDIASMKAMLDQIPIDRILFAGNYPWEENLLRGKEFMGELKECGAIGKEEWERIVWRNAEVLFGLKSTAANERGAARLGARGGSSFG